MNVGNTIQLLTKQSSLAKKHASFLHKLSKIILECHFQSPSLSKISAITEYLQLISQALLLYPSQTNNDSLFFQAFFYCAKLINPSNLLEFQENNKTTTTVLCLILVWLVFRYAVYLYIILAATVLNKKDISSFWLKIFKIVFNFQAKFLYYFISSFWVCAILAYKETKFSLFGFGEAAQYAFCTILVLAEFLTTMLPRLCYFYILPNKSFLASKNNSTENITLLQKFIIQILQISLLLDSKALQWILVIVNLGISSFRSFYFLTDLPFYNIKSLYFHAGLLAIVSSLNLAGLFQLIFQSFDDHLLIIIWIILGILSFKIATQVLTRKLRNLVNQEESSINSPLLLVHKMNLMKQFLTFQEKSQLLLNKNIPREFYLIAMNIHNSLISTNSQENNTTPAEILKANTLTCFEQLSSQHPTNSLFNLHFAYYSAKINKIYGKSMMLINKVQQKRDPTLQANGSFLLGKIQDKIKAQYRDNKLVLDLHTFVSSQIYVDKLKQKMLEQSELQFKVYRELTQNSPNLYGVFKSAQKVKAVKRKIESRIAQLSDQIPLQHLTPLMLCAHYYLILNNSPDDYNKFEKKFHLQYKKFKTQFEAENLCYENIYDENSTAFFLVSAEKQDLGKVSYCSNSVKKVYGGDASHYLGSTIFSNIALPSLRPVFEEEYRALTQKGTSAGLNQIRRCYNLHKEGYIIEVDTYKNLHPMVTQGFYLTLIAREVARKNEFIIMRENGDIEGGSRKITKQLGIYVDNSNNSKYHIGQISEELEKVNEAFNLINSISKQKRTSRQIMEMEARKNSRLSVSEGSYLYSLYSEKGEGGVLTLNSVKEKSGFNYHCKISFYVFQALTFKIITLEDKIKNNNLKRNSKFLIPHDLHIAITSNPDLENDAKTSTKNLDEDETPRTPKSPDSDKSEDFVSNGEKDHGWIDFVPLHSRQTEVMSPRVTERRRLCEGFPETIPDSRRDTNELLTTTRALKIQVNSQKVKKKHSLAEKTERLDTNQNSRDKTTNLKRSNSIKTIKALHNALDTKHYAKSYQFITLCYFLFILSVIAATFHVFLGTKNTTETLQIKTDTMVNSQLKAYYLVTTQTLVRSIHDKKLGLITPADAALYKSPVEALVAIGRKYVQLIVQTSRMISHNADFLDKSAKEILYKKDVQIIYQDSVAEMTNFQATDTIIQAILDALDAYQNSGDVDETTFNFIIINLLNDLDTKNDKISTLLLESVTNQVQGLKNGFLIYTGIILGLCVFLFAVIIVQICTQYKNCLKHTLGLLYLDHQSLKLLVENQTNFQKTLKGISNFDEVKFYSFKELSQEGFHHKSSKKSYSANDSGIKKSFLLILMKFIILLTVLTLVTILTKISAPNLMEYLNDKMYQMSFLSSMAAVATRAISASIELPLQNSTAPMGGKEMTIALEEYIDKIDLFKNELVDLFLDTKELPRQMQEVLYGDGCKVLGIEDAIYCGILASNSVDSGLIQIMGTFKNLLDERYLDYENSDKSVEALRKNRLLKIDLLLSLKRVIADECILINQILKSDFERHLILFNSQKDIAFYVSLIWLLITARIIWRSILHPLKENDNKFKDILRMFPAKLVISNFIFKVFLMKSSPNNLYFLKT